MSEQEASFDTKHYPSYRYHAKEPPLIVTDPSDEDDRAPYAAGWRKSPTEAEDVRPVVTFEVYIGAGYAPESYPPAGYDAVETPAFADYRATQAALAAERETAERQRVADESGRKAAEEAAPSPVSATEDNDFTPVASDGVEPFPYFEAPVDDQASAPRASRRTRK